MRLSFNTRKAYKKKINSKIIVFNVVYMNSKLGSYLPPSLLSFLPPSFWECLLRIYYVPDTLLVLGNQYEQNKVPALTDLLLKSGETDNKKNKYVLCQMASAMQKNKAGVFIC